MNITVLGQTVCMEGIRVIRKELKVYTLIFPHEETEGSYENPRKTYLPTGLLIDKIAGKTFIGEEYEDYVEIDLNKIIDNGVQSREFQNKNN